MTDRPDAKPYGFEHILQFFAYAHLPSHLQAVSKPFCELAHAMVDGDNGPESGTTTFGPPLPRNPERTVALRKLLEAKDAAVRALVAKAMLVLALASVVACGSADPLLPTPVATPTPPPTCQILVNGDNAGIIVCGNGATITQPKPAPADSPGAGAIAGVDIVGIVGGEHCTIGTPANLSKTVGVGCYLDGTINPYSRDAAGNKVVIFDTALTGIAPERFERRDSFSGATVSQDGGQPYNWRLTCSAVGTVVLSATVKGVSSGDVAFGCK